MSARVLVIDCATPALSIALFDGTDCLAAHHETLGRGHAEALLPAIAALPDGGRAESILVDVGPGSFTGVRVGLAAANALGFAWGIPVHGYGCLDLVGAMARQQLAPPERFAIVMVGGHGELFWTMADAAEGAEAAPMAITSTPIDALATMLDVPLLVGSGAQTLVDAGARGRAVPLLPDARETGLLSARQRSLPPRPIYGRGADAKPMAPVTRPAQPAGAR
jgi:tRNA threonylcarbamoyl adenosine modification protein YeaZ